MRFLTQPTIIKNPNPRVPLAAVVCFRPSEPGRTRIDIRDPDRQWSVEFGPERPPTEGLPILGMRPDRDHELRVTLIAESGVEVTAPAPLHYRTPPLPSGHDFPRGIRINRDDLGRRALVVGDGVAEMDRKTGDLLWEWSAFDHMDPYRIGYGGTDDYWAMRGFEGALDWTHGNGATYDARDDSVIVSLRHQDALVKVDRASGGIKWILGEPTACSSPSTWPAGPTTATTRA